MRGGRIGRTESADALGCLDKKEERQGVTALALRVLALPLVGDVHQVALGLSSRHRLGRQVLGSEVV